MLLAFSLLLLLLPSTLSDSTPSRLRLILVRHGESQNNVLNEISKQNYIDNRYPDPHLTPLGLAQAKATAKHLTSRRCNPLLSSIDSIIVSPMMRCCQTARPIAKRSQVKATVWEDAYETSGSYEGKGTDTVGVEGMTPDEIKDKFGYDTSLMEVDTGGWYKLPTQESYKDGVSRIEKVGEKLKRMARECEESGVDKTVCLVVHGNFIDILLNFLMKMPNDPLVARFRTYNTSLSAVDICGKSGMCALLWSNYHDHLGKLCKKTALGVV